MASSPFGHRGPERPGADRWPARFHPTPSGLAVAVSLSLAASLVADGLLVALGTRLFPGVRHYGHLRFSDYATLTAVGVVAAGAAWPVVCRISGTPRRLYLQLAVVVTAALWIPDLYLLLRHQPARGVAVLMVMHLAVAVVTYQCMVRLAPPRAGAVPGDGPRPGEGAIVAGPGGSDIERAAWWLAGLVGVEFALGIGTLASVPTGRPSGWWPDQGRLIYLGHALVGLPLALMAAGYLGRARASTRLHRLSGWIGGAGVLTAGLGGVLTVLHPLRLVGVGLMLAGPVVAGFGYLIPWFDRLSDEGPGQPGEPGGGSAGAL